MKKFGVYSVLTVSAFGFLLGLSPLKAHAGLITTDTLTFKNTGGNSLGGYSTYPYYFNIKTAAGTTTTGVPLLCVSFQDTIQPTESWQADVYTVGSTYLNTDTKNSLVPVLNTAQQDADTWIYSQVVSLESANPSVNALSIEEWQWAAWMVGDSQLYNLSTNQLWSQYHLTKQDVTAIDQDVNQAETTGVQQLTSFYAGYELFVPVVSKYDTNPPQSFIGPAPCVTPEPSSFILFGSGLLTAAGALYRRKRRTA